MKVRLLNFRCFHDAEIELGPLTVILGANASGKTSILRALDPALILTERDVWRREPGRETLIRVSGGPRGSYEVAWSDGHGARIMSPTSGGNWMPVHLQGIHPETRFGYQYLDLNPKKLRSSGRLKRSHRLDGVGGNLVQVFDSLTPDQQLELAAEFCQLVPVFSSVAREALEDGSEEMALKFKDAFKDDVWYTPDEVSDGSILTLAFLLLPYQQPFVDILVIEEPERSLHPYLVERVIVLLRALAEGRLGRGHKMRVVLTTHSPSTVDFCQPDEIRILDRQPDGSVQIRQLPTGTADWREGFEIHGRSLGSIWMSGGVGGVPTS